MGIHVGINQLSGSTSSTLVYAILTVALLFVVLVAGAGIVVVYIQQKRATLGFAGIKRGINMMEKERARMAADLHDDLGASLSAIKLQLQLIDVNNEQQALMLGRSARYIDDAMKKLKTIAFNLMPRLLEQEGLCTALNELVEMLINRAAVKVDFYCSVNPGSAEQSLHIYRIVQEIIANIGKHAGATSVKIDIRRVRQYINVHITDNGTGFDKVMAMRAGSGLGLQNIRSRADVLNARLSLKTKPGSGTGYLIKIPCK